MVARLIVVLTSVGFLVLGCGGDDGGGTKPVDSPPAPNDGPGPGDDAAPPDGTGPTVDAAISVGPACGATTCTGTDICCLGSTTTCKAPAMCPTQSFACDGPEDCNGGTCCFGNGGQGGSECGGSNCGAIACHDDGDCGGGTPKCCPRPFTPGYNVCLAACL